jgi:poly-gamma-glutamate synthesis protein (capsule biosynthesis protein)
MKAFFIALAVSLACFTSATSQTSSTSSTGETSKTCLLFTGDILLDRGVRKVIERHGTDYLFTRKTDSLFRAAQVVVGNLECPATRIKAPVQKRFIFRGEPEWLDGLRKHGFTHLNLANNHSIDQGRKGLTDTRENILKARMKPVGMGKNLQEAAQPVLLTSCPRKVWLIASLGMALENFAYLPDRPCVNTERTPEIIERIRDIKRKDPQAVVLVSIHWGGEHTLKPVPSQRLDAHRLINAGADALICHHTHTLQTIEHYKGRDIYYSIGNFIFDQQKPLNSKACVVKVEVTKDHVRTQVLPIYIQGCVPHLK